MTGAEIAIAASAASAGISALGSIQAGKAQQAAANYNAQVAENEAIAARQQAEYEERRHRDRLRRLQGQARAQLGGSGIDLEGSPLLVLADNAMEGELDALAIRYGGDVAVIRSTAEAAAQRAEGRAARTGSFFRAGSSLLSGASRIAQV